MNSQLTIAGQKVRPKPADAKGKGGEADVFGLGDFYADGRQIALKVYKAPDHPDHTNPDGSPNLHERQAAERRLSLASEKLRAFPKNLPAEVVSPIDLATDAAGHVVGYTMEFLNNYEVLLRFAEPAFRPISKEGCQRMLAMLHSTVDGTHKADVVMGDFNDLNVMVPLTGGLKVRVIDADSMQFGRFTCVTYTTTFVDPLICAAGNGGPVMNKPHTKLTDWYAFAVMYMQTLLFLKTGPYGGVYKPKDKAKRLPHADRWQARRTVFDPEVIYPRPSLPMRVLPDDVLHYLEQTFVYDKREVFPSKYLNLNWTICNCGVEHARPSCPVCQTASPTAKPEVTRVKGKVKATTVFETKGQILYATSQDGKLRWLSHDGNGYVREDGSTVLGGVMDVRMRFRIQGDRTLFGKGNSLVMLGGARTVPTHVDTFGTALPIFDANDQHVYWLQHGRLVSDVSPNSVDAIAGRVSRPIGDVLEGQTLFWVGPTFGFGFYRAAELSVAFVFGTTASGINDSVRVPIEGTLVDSTCAFSDWLCWFLCTTKKGSKLMSHCYVIQPDGKVIASVSADQGDLPWLDNIRGNFASKSSLFVPTDDGLQVYREDGGQIVLSQEFPDTARFMDSSSNLFNGKQGIYVVGKRQIDLLQIA